MTLVFIIVIVIVPIVSGYGVIRNQSWYRIENSKVYRSKAEWQNRNS